MRPPGAVYRFGPFSVDRAAFRLLRGDEIVSLSPKHVDLLLYLVERPSTLATKEELFAALWPDVAVTDNALTQAVSELRQALGDRAGSPRFIQTVARRGYRFIAPVEVVTPPAPEAPAVAVEAGGLDQIVAQVAARLAIALEPAPAARPRLRETTSLDALRALNDGRLRLEALDGGLVPDAISDFERAIALDPRYAAAHVGLANAHFWRYEMSRLLNRLDAAALAEAVNCARRAVELDEHLAEAHATLALVLVSAGRSADALAAGRRAVELEPSYWGHYFRLGHAAWGEERLRALARALELYPEFPYAHFELAMVHLARGAFDAAEQVLREGALVQDRQSTRRERFPARGLHWLLGMLRLARGDPDEALDEFDREIRAPAGQLHAAEFAINALDGQGAALLALDRPEEAAGAFRRALDLYAGHARSRLGLSAAERTLGRREQADAALAQAREAVRELRRGGQTAEAALVAAGDHALGGAPLEAVDELGRLLAGPGPAFTGWTIPVEPFLQSLRETPGFPPLLDRLRDRAR